MTIQSGKRILTLAAAVAVLLLSGAAGALEIEKSPNDERLYRYIELDNGLRALLISDPDTDKAAASLDVNVGSGADPVDRQGLAHYLEHLLFLGTEKYPDADGYKRFIASHGGSNNAYTALENTNYYFDVDKDFLEPALDRFAQFFIAPLFNEKYVDRERQVVHSEYQSNLRDDGWRVRSAQRDAYHPDHPGARFNIGSSDTLAERAGRPSVRDELIAFYQRHYSAELMSLVVLGKEPLERLEDWVREKFGAVANRDAAPPKIDVPRYPPESLPLRIDVVPIKDTRRLTLSWLVPDLTELYRSKPLYYIGNLLGHEGEGSLLSLLKTRGWANSLWAGRGEGDSGGDSFTVSIELTEAGFERLDELVAQVFATLRLVRDGGVERWRFDEQRRLAEIGFQFQEESAPRTVTRSLAAALHLYPPQDILRIGSRMDRFDAALIERYLGYLTPDTLIMTVVAPELDALADRTDPWFSARYRIGAVADETLARWRSAPPDEALSLAAPNPFIPETLALKSPATAFDRPELIKQAPGFRFWHQQDDTFRVPRAELYFSIRSPRANSTPRQSMLTRLYVKLLNDALAEFSYPARLAGLGYSLYRHVRGIAVRVSGYDEKQAVLLGEILDALDRSTFSEARFRIVKDELRRGLRNRAEEPPYRRAYSEVYDLLMRPSWSERESLAALEPLTLDDLHEFIPSLTERLSVTALAHGNLDRFEALGLAETLQRRLMGRGQPVDVARAVALRLEPGDYRRDLDVDGGEAALLVYFQSAVKDVSSRARYALLGHMISDPFFDDLRTENKLGYIVSASPLSIMEAPGLVFVVQSPSAGPDALDGHVERFLGDYRRRLAAMDRETFEKRRLSLLTLLRQRDKTLQARTSRYWSEIDRGNVEFDSRERLIDAVRAIDKEHLLAEYDRALLGAERRRLAVRAAGAAALAAAAAGAAAAIADPGQFKQGLVAFPD